MRSLRSKTKIQDHRENEETTKVYLSSELPITTVLQLDEKPMVFNNSSTTEECTDKCGEIFRNKDDDFNYLCTICSNLFESIDKFAIHLKIDHNDSCNKKEIENFSEETQIKIDPYIQNEQNSENLNDVSSLVLADEKKEKSDINENKSVNSDRKKYKYKYIRKKNRKYLFCKLCNKRFTSQSYLDSHLIYDHAPMPILMEQEIGNISSDDDNDDDGLDEAEKEKRKEIRKQKKEEKKKQLAQKLHESIAQDPLKCRYCDKRFRGRMNRFEHECLHTGEKHFKCDVCGDSFRKKGSLKTHMLIHQNIKPYDCELCDRKFRSVQHLRIHYIQHKGLKPYKCRYCDKTFGQANNRKSHERTHTKEKPYQCTICGYRFTTGSNLRNHVKLHTNTKVHKCKFCGKAYVANYDLKVHEKIHVSEGRHQCNICDARFLTYRGLKIHMNGHTKSGIQVTDQDIALLPNVTPDKTVKASSTSTSKTLETTPKTDTNVVENEKNKNLPQQLSQLLSYPVPPTAQTNLNGNSNYPLPFQSLFPIIPMSQGPLNMSMPNMYGSFTHHN